MTRGIGLGCEPSVEAIFVFVDAVNTDNQNCIRMYNQFLFISLYLVCAQICTSAAFVNCTR